MLTALWINACTLRGNKERTTLTWAKAPKCTRVQAASPWQARADLCHCPRGCTRQLVPGEGPVCDVCFVETTPQPPPPATATPAARAIDSTTVQTTRTTTRAGPAFTFCSAAMLAPIPQPEAEPEQ